LELNYFFLIFQFVKKKLQTLRREETDRERERDKENKTNNLPLFLTFYFLSASLVCRRERETKKLWRESEMVINKQSVGRVKERNEFQLLQSH